MDVLVTLVASLIVVEEAVDVESVLCVRVEVDKVKELMDDEFDVAFVAVAVDVDTVDKDTVEEEEPLKRAKIHLHILLHIPVTFPPDSHSSINTESGFEPINVHSAMSPSRKPISVHAVLVGDADGTAVVRDEEDNAGDWVGAEVVGDVDGGSVEFSVGAELVGDVLGLNVSPDIVGGRVGFVVGVEVGVRVVGEDDGVYTSPNEVG